MFVAVAVKLAVKNLCRLMVYCERLRSLLKGRTTLPRPRRWNLDPQRLLAARRQGPRATLHCGSYFADCRVFFGVNPNSGVKVAFEQFECGSVETQPVTLSVSGYALLRFQLHPYHHHC